MPLCLLLLCLLSGSAVAPTPDAVLAEIRNRGAHGVVLKVFDDEEFEEIVYTGVSSGSSKWVQVGAALLPHADASVSLGLASSLAVALIHSPENVLPLVNSSPVFAASRICLPFMSDEEPDELHVAHLRKLERSLEKVSAPALQEAKLACTRELVAMRRLLRKQT